jgi:RecA-family ATPase
MQVIKISKEHTQQELDFAREWLHENGYDDDYINFQMRLHDWDEGDVAESILEQQNNPLLIKASDVEYSPPRWIMEPLFQEGKGTLIQGDNGAGKTAFMCGIAALISSGKPLLGYKPVRPGRVLIISVEDELSTLRGRIVFYSKIE